MTENIPRSVMLNNLPKYCLSCANSQTYGHLAGEDVAERLTCHKSAVSKFCACHTFTTDPSGISTPATISLSFWLHSSQSTGLLEIWRTARCPDSPWSLHILSISISSRCSLPHLSHKSCRCQPDPRRLPLETRDEHPPWHSRACCCRG